MTLALEGVRTVAVRDYEGNGIVVHWDAERCVHSMVCVGGAPEVFDPQARPWVTATARPADELAAVIDTCPSGALSYTRTDGGQHGRRGHAADADPTDARRADGDVPASDADAAPPNAADAAPPAVTLRRDGPLVVQGPVTLVTADGTSEVHDQLFLCRCGASNDKPRCDGSHKRIGFTADGVAPPARAPV